MTQDDNVVIKKVELELEWEIFSVKFSVSHPLGNEHGQMILMGNHDETKNIMMKKSRVKFPWMQTKYGDNSDPWDYTVKFPNIEGGVDGALKHDASFSNFIYFYGWQDYKTNQVVFERFP